MIGIERISDGLSISLGPQSVQHRQQIGSGRKVRRAGRPVEVFDLPSATDDQDAPQLLDVATWVCGGRQISMAQVAKGALRILEEGLGREPPPAGLVHLIAQLLQPLHESHPVP